MRRALVALVVVCAVVGSVAGTAGAVIRKPHAGPVRVLLMGDSITTSYQARAAELLGPGYAVTGAGSNSSSLLDADVCNGARAKELVAQVDPDVVVVEYAGNYARRGPACTPAVVQGDAKFYKRWSVSVRKNNNLLKAKGARVLWVLVPVPQRVPYTAMTPQLNAIYLSRAGANTVDAWTSFGGSTYDASLHVPNDGLHLSPEGVERMAQTVEARIRG
jgi:lysophospholipase L1-like esterase